MVVRRDRDCNGHLTQVRTGRIRASPWARDGENWFQPLQANSFPAPLDISLAAAGYNWLLSRSIRSGYVARLYFESCTESPFKPCRLVQEHSADVRGCF